MSNVKPPIQRLRGITIKSTTDGVAYTLEPAGRDELKLVPEDTEGTPDGPAGRHELSVKSLKANLKRGAYYFPDPDDHHVFNSVAETLENGQ